MNAVLVTLFCLITGSVINAASFQRSTLISEDASELTRLIDEFWSLKPAALLDEGPLLICQFIDECCEGKDRDHAISSLVSSIDDQDKNDISYNSIIDKCINSTDLKESIQSCPSLRGLLYPVFTEQEVMDITEYGNAIINFVTKLNLTDNEEILCEKEDLYASFCSSNATLVKRCLEKELQHTYDHVDQKSYQKQVMKVKQILTDTIQQLFQREMKKTLKEIKPFLRVLSKYYSEKH